MCKLKSKKHIHTLNILIPITCDLFQNSFKCEVQLLFDIAARNIARMPFVIILKNEPAFHKGS